MKHILFTLSIVVLLGCPAGADVQHSDGNNTVQRVPDRSERIDFVLDPRENWELLNHESHPGEPIEVIEFGRAVDAYDNHTESVELFVFHNSWRTDLDAAEGVFFQALEASCPGTQRKHWLREDLDTPRRVTVFRKPAGSECENSAIVQLLLQGADNFYSVNLYLAGEVPDGLIVKWVHRLQEVQPCIFDHRRRPCPEGIWDAKELRQARERRPQGEAQRPRR